MSITAKNLSFSYDAKKLVLNNITFEVNQGDFIGVMGLSGCGKTTLLRLLLGLNSLNEGELRIDNILYKKENLDEIRKLISYIPQHGALYPHMRVIENILLPIKIKRKISSDDLSKVKKFAKICNIDEDLLSKYPSELSGGQRQRISILRALLMNTPYIFLDEPLSSLDPITKVSIQKEFKNIFKETNKTIVMITHGILEAKFLCDKLMIINNGEVEQFDTTQKVMNSPAEGFVSDFLNSQN